MIETLIIVSVGVVVNLLVIAFLFGKISSNIEWLKKDAKERKQSDTKKFGGIFNRIDEIEKVGTENKTEIRNIKEYMKECRQQCLHIGG